MPDEEQPSAHLSAALGRIGIGELWMSRQGLLTLIRESMGWAPSDRRPVDELAEMVLKLEREHRLWRPPEDGAGGGQSA